MPGEVSDPAAQTRRHYSGLDQSSLSSAKQILTLVQTAMVVGLRCQEELQNSIYSVFQHRVYRLMARFALIDLAVCIPLSPNVDVR